MALGILLQLLFAVHMGLAAGIGAIAACRSMRSARRSPASIRSAICVDAAGTLQPQRLIGRHLGLDEAVDALVTMDTAPDLGISVIDRFT